MPGYLQLTELDSFCFYPDTGPLSQFTSLHLSSPLLKALHEEGYHTPTPIQAKAIPIALEGKDILGCAQTGTGKTAAFALPILHKLHSEKIEEIHGIRRVPRALILAPTRELATQIGESFENYGRHTGLRSLVVYGGVSQFVQVKELMRGIDILIATPGRLIDLMQQRHIVFREIGIFVLDEADRMLDMGFIQPIRQIAKEIPTPRQTLLFSATMPREIQNLAHSLLHNPVKISVAPVASSVPQIEQVVYFVQKEKKLALLEQLLGQPGVDRALVFTRTKYGADKLTRKLQRTGVSAGAIHGDKAQNQRERALENFRTGRSWVLVATDVAARGLDIDNVTHVFNFDVPNEPEAYVHRIGRTGRAGATGIAIALCDPQERAFLRDIEKLTGKQITINPTPEGLQQEVKHPAPPRNHQPHSHNSHRPHGSHHGSHHKHSGHPKRRGGPRRRSRS